MTMRPLTSRQLTVLRQFIAAYRKEIRVERHNWGAESAKQVELTGINLAAIDRTIATALIQRGLIKVTRQETRTHEVLRRGAYGRWLGGTKAIPYVERVGRPTATAIRLVEEMDGTS